MGNDICSDYSPDTKDFVIGDTQNSISGYTMLSKSFIESEKGYTWLNSHYETFRYYQGYSDVMVTVNAIATSDNFLLKYSNNRWIRISEPDADSSTYDFDSFNNFDSI